ncbi:hypothetical protein [Nocardia farcinica]|uniref:hypothetical protein n=1 Tax=Nocardia farcinica TaxID=37329 RepID=UPI003432FE7F
MKNWIHLTEAGDEPVWINAGHVASIAVSNNPDDGTAATISLAGGSVYDVVETVAEVMRRVTEATTPTLHIGSPVHIASPVGPPASGDRADLLPTPASLLIYGASDDLVEVEGIVTEEYDATSGDAVTLLIAAPTGPQLHVRAEHTSRGWELSAIHRDPDWRWTVQPGTRPDHAEDPALLLDVPPGTTVTHLEASR